MGLLEGNEVDKQVGPAHVIVDVTPELKVKVSVQAEVDILAELHKLAAKSANPLDDKAVAALEWVKNLLQVAGA